MEQATRTSSRGGLLGRCLLLAVGAVGLGSGRARAAVVEGNRTELRLYARNVHLHAPSHRPGRAPAHGDRHNAYGELLDRPGGKVVGHFTSARFAQESPFAAVASSLEIHTFTLKEGTVHGLGSASSGADGHFVILGGTGRYSGVQGSYVARQHMRELGGDGAAEFHLTLTGQESANGV